MKILVTGGFGYLGARIAEFLVKQGHHVLAGTRNKLNRPINKKFHTEIVQISWNEQEKIDEICKGVDLVIHTAGMNASDCAENPVSALEVNSIYTSRLVQSSIKQGVKRFLYISTVHVYSDLLQGVISEDSYPVNLHPYAYSHKVAEDVVNYANKKGLIEGMVFRLSNGIGPPIYKNTNCWSLLVNDLCMQSVRDKKLFLHSDGTQSRNFIPISEVCNLIDHLVCNNRFTLSTHINVGMQKSFTLFEMAELIQSRTHKLFGYFPPISKTEKSSDNNHLILDYKIDTLLSLGYKFQYSIEDEIDELIKYCFKHS